MISLDSLTYAGNLENIADLMSHERLSFVHGDIRDAGLMAELVADVDVIVNAAAESHVEKSIEEGASEFVTTNVEGTQILLDAIRRTPVERFILISSSEVYGTAETDPDGRAPPARAAQPVRRDEGRRRPARVQLLRHLRPADRDRAAVQQLRARASTPRRSCRASSRRRSTGEPLTIHGDGHASRDWLYVDDHAEAIEALIEAPIETLAGEVVNVATGVDISVAEIADLVLAAVGDTGSTKVHVPERLGQVDRHIGSTDKMAGLTGWQARTTFADGLEQTVAWYRENEAWWRSVLGHSRHVSSS